MRKRFIAITVFLVLWAISFDVIGEHSSWDCPGCGRTGNTGNYCGGCGCPAPSNEENQAAIKKEPSYYAITWQDDTGKTIDITTVEYGEKPTHADPKKEADQQYVYTFSGWQPHLENVTGDATYKATFEKKARTYTVTWLDESGKLIDTTSVAYGYKPTHEVPRKESDQQHIYTFAGWQPYVEIVTRDATYKATFWMHDRYYKVTWQDESGKTIDTTSVKYGNTPVHKEPTKESDQQYTYIFSGWQPAVEKVTGDVTYKATFKKEKRLNTGDIITFGHYEQDNNMKNGPEPIEWIVLDVQDERYMVLSKNIIDAHDYWHYMEDWLNDTFLNTAFTVDERSKILEIEIEKGLEQEYPEWRHDSISYRLYVYKNERGKVFLLSYAEALKYLGVTKGKNMTSRSSPTAYAVSKGAYISDFNKTEEGKNSGWWWLRSYGSHSSESHATVNSNGSLDESIRENTHGGIRPAIWIKDVPSL